MKTSMFFVAFSRAKQRVYFTFSQIRDSGRYGALRRETRNTIVHLSFQEAEQRLWSMEVLLVVLVN